MEAEFRALLDGLKLMEEHGLYGYKISIKSDSLVLVESVLGKFDCAWFLWSFMAQIKERFGKFVIQIRHIYREANFVADSLANRAVDDGFSSVFSVSAALPSSVKWRLMQDQIGLPVVHKKRMVIFDDKG